MPKYCIVIPSYNSALTILDAVRSAVEVDCQDYSVVVSDNASEDGTASIANSIDSSRLKVIGNDILLGKSENWNRAYSQADDCEYFVNLHSDDVLSRNVLKHIDKAIKSDVVLVHGSDYRVSFDNSKIIKRRYYPLKYSLSGNAQRKSLLLGNSVGIVGTAIRRTAYQKLGGWSLDYAFYQDVELWYQLAEFGRNIYVPEKFGLYRAPETNDPEKFVDETIRWYGDKIKAGLENKMERAAVDSLKRIVNRNVLLSDNFSEGVVKKMECVLEEYRQYPKYRLGAYVHNNIIKFMGTML